MKQMMTLWLVLTSAYALGNCKDYVDEMRVTAELEEEGEYFEEKAAVDQVFKTFDIAKGDSPEYRQMLTGIVANLKALTAADVQRLFYQTKPCNSITIEYRALKGLLGSVRHYKLGAEKEARATKLTLDYLKARGKNPGTLIEQMIHVELLKKLSDDGFVKTDQKLKEAIMALRLQAERIKMDLSSSKRLGEGGWPATLKDFKKLPANHQRLFVEELQFELKYTEQIRHDLNELTVKL